tara:strand:+ start:1109 stop:1624 length:516 start_codon:yes stop_codon:yes gene_type:complete
VLKQDRNTIGIFARFLEFIYLSVFEVCQIPLTHGYYICKNYRSEFPKIISPFCKNCGESFEGKTNDKFRCQNCDGLKADFSFARASLKGLTLSFRLVHELKYQRQFFIARELALFLKETLEEDPRFAEFKSAILVPVPFFWQREQWRQGKKTCELSRELSRLSGHETIEAI